MAPRKRTPMAVKGNKANRTKFREDANDDVGYADHYNAKNSKYSESYDKETGASSAQEYNDAKARSYNKGDSRNVTTDSEVARQSRRKNKPVSPSGPGSRGDFSFFKVTTKGK